jgi:hypothetical protein
VTRRKRLFVALAFSGVSLVIGCCVAIHVIVSTRILRNWVNTSPEELQLDYDAASAWVPGLIRIRGLTMRGSDRNVQWFFRMEKATISVSLLDLLRKRFHATHVRAAGLVFRLRQRAEKGELSPAHLARIPKIPGFTDPPLKIETPEPPPPSPEARRRFWLVHIEDLVADPAPEIWIEIYRFRGRARVTGGFSLRPHVEARVGPAAVRFLSGDITLGPEEPLLASATGGSDCVIDPHAPDEVHGQEIWRKISGSIALEGRLVDLRFVNHFLRRSKEPRLAGGSGAARFSVRFNHGVGRGRADFEAAGVAATYARGTLSGKAKGRLEIPSWDVEHGNMEISGSHVDLSDILTIRTPRDERDWWGRFNVPTGRLHDGLAAQTAVSCRDARPLYTLFRADLPGWAQGLLKLEGVNATARVRVAHDLVDVEDMEASGGKFHIAGRYRQEGSATRGAFLVETGPLAVGIAIDGESSHVKLLGARKWFREAGN